MATGLEAVGAASAIIQLITFAGTLASLTIRIYDGRPTPENELEEYAAKVSDAAHRVQTRAKKILQATPEEKKLFQVAQECLTAAEGVRKEAESITKGFQKGKALKAVYAAFRANYHKKKMQELDLSLERCKKIMETELLQSICDKGDAVQRQQTQGFQKLDSDVQNLITQIASGNIKIEGLFVQESNATRDMINTSLASELKALDVRTVSEAQRQRFLKSLKSEDIRQRYNNVMSSSAACFERVFASYERVCSQDPKHKAWSDINEASHFRDCGQLLEEEVDEIDRSWDTFCSWLRSNDSVFWVQGKPGSGKSTLMKFIINNNNTKSLLESWSPSARVLSHFFWKIGNDSQNSIKGLLCSLLHDILSNDNGAIEWVLRQFPFSQSKDFYGEWSTEEANEILFSLLQTSSRFTCIFIDGLDEISNKDGFRALMAIIERLWSCPKVKLCTSSRPETELVSKFEAMRVHSLQLEDLTRPEMAVYIHNEVDQFPGRISVSLMEYFKSTLLQKAQGVFLWLFLATGSLTDGIRNGDHENILFERLQELPGQLEVLYEAMWSRLGGDDRVYRETAARYFNCVIYGGWQDGITFQNSKLHWPGGHGPTIAHLSLVRKTGSRGALPSRPRTEDLKWLSTLCDKTVDDIKTRCAGMLRIGSQSLQVDHGEHIDFPSEIFPLTRPVEFIHRTAHDFLVDTEIGQSILNYKTDAQALLNLHIELAHSWLYLVGLYSHLETGFVQNLSWAVDRYKRLEDEGVSKSTTLGILSVIQDLQETGAGSLKCDRFSFPLEVFFGFHFNSYEDTFLSHRVRPDTTDPLNSGLLGIASLIPRFSLLATSVKLMHKIIELGGDPHAIGTPPVVQEASEQGSYIVKQTTTLGLLLQQAVAQNYPGIKRELDVIVPMAQTCQDWHRKILVACTWSVQYVGFELLTFWNELLYLNREVSENRVVFEVDMRFLLLKLLNSLRGRGLPTYVDKLHQIVDSFTGFHVRIRHIATYQRVNEEVVCYRILAQKPFQDIINSLCEPQNVTNMARVSEVGDLMYCFSSSHVLRGAYETRMKSFEGGFVKVSYAAEMDYLVKEGLLSRET
ncbi:hypothetical protein HG530_012493 [Fusarium avenaceum]|nr:hypothetical protein HG530_012493 [Fusarium avenaceum]